MAQDLGRTQNTDQPPASGALFGRAQELDVLHAWWSTVTPDADRRKRSLLVLDGPAGIGKTHLASEFLLEVAAFTSVGLTGALPADANPFPALTRDLLAELNRTDQTLPEETLRELQPLADQSAAAPPSLPPKSEARPGAPQKRARRKLDLNRINDRPHHRAFAHLVRMVADARPGGVLLLIDDLQWANPAACHLLRDLVLNPPHPAMGILATCRPDPPAAVASLLQELQQSEQVTHVELTGLDVTALGTLLAHRGVAQEESSKLAESLIGMTGGNPLLVETVVAASTPTAEPVGLRAAVASRLADLRPETLSAITQLAVLGRSSREDTLLAALGHLRGQPGVAVDLRSVLHDAVTAGLVEHYSNTQSVRFTHDEYRESALGLLTPEELNAHHAAAAQALDSSNDADGASQLHHLMQSGAEPGRVARIAADAAERATANGQWDEAIPLLTIALSMVESSPDEADLPDRGVLLPELAEAQRRTAHPDADQTVAAAYEHAKDQGDLDAMVRMALLRPRTGDFSLLGGIDHDVFGRLETCLGRVDPADRPAEAALIRAAMAEELLFANDGRRRDLAAEAVRFAKLSEDQAALSVAMLARRNTMSSPDELDERINAGRELVDHATRVHNEWDLAWGHMALSGNLLERGDRDGCELRVELASGINERLRSRYIEYILATRRTSSLIMNEEFDKAELSALADLRLGESAGFDQGYTIGLYGSQLCKMRTAQGRAGELVDSFEFMIDQVPTFLPYRAALAWILAEARIDGAAEHVSMVARDDFADVPFDYWWVTTLSLIGRTAAMIGDLDTAAAALEKLKPYSGQIVWSGTVVLGPVDWQLGGLAATLGDLESAVPWLERAADQCSRMGMRCSLRSIEPELTAARSGRFTLEDLRLTPHPNPSH